MTNEEMQLMDWVRSVAVGVLATILEVAVVVGVLILLLKLEKRIAYRIYQTKKNINMRFVDNITRFVFIIIAVWIILSILPLPSDLRRALFSGTAVLTAILGFAAQPVISDLICGMMISLYKPFDIGDRIELEDGTAGVVKDINLRHVTLVNLDTVTVIVPNSKLNAMKLKNMSYRTQTRSIDFRFQISYDADPTEAMRVIRDVVVNCPYAVPGKPGKDGMEYGPVYFIAYNDSSLEMATVVYYEPTVSTETVKCAINTGVNRALKDAGIEIPYSYVNVVMQGERHD